MTCSPGTGLMLVPGLALAFSVEAACLVLASHPDGRPLGAVGVADAGPTFTISYVHSVTRTPVEEHYRIEGTTIVQTGIYFVQHGPGLPTEADAGGTWRREADGHRVTMQRRFDAIAMRVHADQSPRLWVTGNTGQVDLARWGNRALALTAGASACPDGSDSSGLRAR